MGPTPAERDTDRTAPDRAIPAGDRSPGGPGHRPAIWVGGNTDDEVAAAVADGGGRVTATLDEAEAIIWTSGPAHFPASIPPEVRWVQLPSAGVESWVASGKLATGPVWTTATGAYAPAVAEHAVTLLLAGVRQLAPCIRAGTWRKGDLDSMDSPAGSLAGARVGILGCGGIGRAMIPLLTAFGADVVAVNRDGRPIDGAARTYAAGDVERFWPDVEHVIVAAPATPETRHLVGREELAELSPRSWIVNIARGSLIDTGALLDAVRAGSIGGAALDVTDPEPLPDGHPLWSEPRVIITPHVANPLPQRLHAFAGRVRENVARFAAGEQLLAVFDHERGY